MSEDQPAVIAYALREASRLKTSLRVVHYYLAHAGDVHLGSEAHEPMRAARAEILRQIRTGIEADGSTEHVETVPIETVPIEYVLARGEAGTILVEQAESAAALVVGADEVGWLERMLGGVERCLNKLKQWRGIAMRSDKTARNYHAGLCHAATLHWLTTSQEARIEGDSELLPHLHTCGFISG